MGEDIKFPFPKRVTSLKESFLINHFPAKLSHRKTRGARLRAPVRKNQTYRGKGGKFDFFHILMSDRLGYN